MHFEMTLRRRSVVNATLGRPTKVRKRPVEVEAMLLWHEQEQAAVDWVNSNGGQAVWHERKVEGIAPYRPGDTNAIETPARLDVHTLEGVMTATYGDWIIRGVKGEFYPCRGDIFETTYEAVER